MGETSDKKQSDQFHCAVNVSPSHTIATEESPVWRGLGLRTSYLRDFMGIRGLSGDLKNFGILGPEGCWHVAPQSELCLPL